MNVNECPLLACADGESIGTIPRNAECDSLEAA